MRYKKTITPNDESIYNYKPYLQSHAFHEKSTLKELEVSMI